MSIVERFEEAGVEGVRVGRFMRSAANTTAVLYRVGSTIIDTGSPNQWPFVRQFLQERPVRRVLVTHHHEDHGGNGAPIQAELNVPVFVPARSVDRIVHGYPMHLYQLIFWGRPRTFQPETLPSVCPRTAGYAEVELEDGLRLRCVSAPGHSDDMTCFLEPNRGWLFAGDLYIASSARYLRDDEDLHAQIRTLRRIVALDFDRVFCGHRGIVADGRGKLRAKLEYLVNLRGRVHAMRREGKSVGQIMVALLGRENHMALLTRGSFSKRNLVRACLTPEHPSEP